MKRRRANSVERVGPPNRFVVCQLSGGRHFASIRFQFVRRFPRHRPLRCRGTSRSTRVWNAQAATARHVGSLCAGRSTSPWFAASSACRNPRDRVQVPRPSPRGWGEERIANELLLKLGIRISPRTVRKYMPKRPRGQPRGDQRWSTFLKNHAAAILACDFFVAVRVTFRTLYVFVVIEHGTRRLAHLNVTSHPSAQWTLQQLREVLGESGDHKYLIHDRDAIYARHLDSSIRALGLEVLRSPIASPKANAICERLIGTIRRECLDWMIPLSEAHLRSILRTWRNHYNTGRPHSALGPGIPDPPQESVCHPDVSNPASNVGACARARQVGAGRFVSRVRARSDAGERVVGQPPSWRRRNGACRLVS
jgi:transposase InsO family protein